MASNTLVAPRADGDRTGTTSSPAPPDTPTASTKPRPCAMAGADANFVSGREHARRLARGRSQAAARPADPAFDGDGLRDDEHSRFAMQTVDDDDLRDIRHDPSHPPEGNGLSVSSGGGPEYGLPPGFQPAVIDLQRRLIVEGNDGASVPLGDAEARGGSLEASEEAVPPPPWCRSAWSARIRRPPTACGW